MAKTRKVAVKEGKGSLSFVTDGMDDEALEVRLVRTLRIPDDGKVYPLPPGLGHFPVKKVEDYKDKVPASWREHGGVFIPLYQREALWLNFRGYTPHAVQVAAGKVNAVDGNLWKEKLQRRGGQNYVVAPAQPWLDGFNVGEEEIRQFTAMPLGMGYTVEGQVTGKEAFGGLQLKVYPAKEGVLESRAWRRSWRGGASGQSLGGSDPMLCASTIGSCGSSPAYSMVEQGAEMGLAEGGRMTQKIYDDPHGLETWDQDAEGGRVFVHIVNSAMYKEITGEDPPPCPITAKTYAKYGYPWFEMYDEAVPSVKGSSVLEGVKSVTEKDKEHGFVGQMSNESVVPKNVKKIEMEGSKDPNEVRDGTW